MKYKSTKTHLVFKMTRKEYQHLYHVLDLGIADLQESLSSKYGKDVKVAQAFCGIETEPDAEPKFKPVRE